MADGGEGLLEVVGGINRKSVVSGPLGAPVEAEWINKGDLAVIEMARASGLTLAGGAEENDPLRASTKGTGELIAQAIKSGCTEIVVGMGGSATTDGGLGCVNELWPHARLREIDLTVAVDVETLFVDAAAVFGPQKGASPSEVALLTNRLQRLAEEYQKDFGVDVTAILGGGAAGGLAGGLAAVGATVVSGFDYLADLLELDVRMEKAQLAITGEGHLDLASLNGKVVGGVVATAKAAGVPVVVIVGNADSEVLNDPRLAGVSVISLTERFGEKKSFSRTAECIETAVFDLISHIC